MIDLLHRFLSNFYCLINILTYLQFAWEQLIRMRRRRNGFWDRTWILQEKSNLSDLNILIYFASYSVFYSLYCIVLHCTILCRSTLDLRLTYDYLIVTMRIRIDQKEKNCHHDCDFLFVLSICCIFDQITCKIKIILDCSVLFR